MMRRWVSRFLGNLVEMLASPEPQSLRSLRQDRDLAVDHAEAVEPSFDASPYPLPAPDPGPRLSVPEISPLPSPDPPNLGQVPIRVPPVDPLTMARYWREALDYVDFGSFAVSTGQREIKPSLCTRLDAAVDMAAVSRQDVDEAPVDAGTDAHAVVMLWERDKRGKPAQGGRRHPLMAVPVTIVGSEFLAPRLEAAPVVNERYLAPDLAVGAFGIGERDDVNARLLSTLVLLADGGTTAPGWGTWWTTCVGVLCDAAGVGSLDALETVLAQRATEAASADRAKAAGWGLYAAVYPATGGGAKPIADVYASLTRLMAAYPRDTALFGCLCGGSNARLVSALPPGIDDRVLGHIDEYEAGVRSLFPLDPTQRDAVRAVLSLEPGELQAVNGPPGSGKTSMLRAVVASRWVAAAHRNAPCPIVVACGATNQSVTNVIEAFGKAPHLDSSVPHARRWIGDATSYGAYLPASTVLNNPGKQAELVRFVCLKRNTSTGFLYEYVNQSNALDPAKALDYEQEYLSYAREALGESDLETVEEAVRLVWQRLDGVEGERRAFNRGLRTRGNWAEVGSRFVLARQEHWTRARRDVALELLLALGRDPSDVQAAQGFMDLTWRAEAFHWAARYWEGQFLLAQRERLLSRHPRNVEEALRRLCMLTPCLVSTLHTVPNLAQIDAAATGGEDSRSHLFGIFDLLVIDEAGQAGPELAGAAFALAKTAAVVGDLKQLAPIWNNTRLAEVAIASRIGAVPFLEDIFRTRRSAASGSALGMARLVSRWTEQDDDGVTLRYHYRCKPSIIDYCNRLSYGGKLMTKTKEDEPFPEPALAWVEVNAEPRPAGGSYFNGEEVEEIVGWVAERWPVWREHEKTRGKPIQDLVAIITPYRPQADRLTERLIQVFKEARLRQPEKWPTEDDVKKVTVGTVHRLQGAERPVVCFSLVEGPEQAGGSFVDRDCTLLNVAVSRAKRSFIVFANPARLFPLTAAADGDARPLPTRLLGTHLRGRDEAKLLYPEKLVLIEAGGKVGALSRILGKSARVVATGGVLLELGLEDGVDIGAGFVPNPRWRAGAEDAVTKAASQAQPVEQFVFATDDDRMGEYIAWQARRALAPALAGKRLSRVRLGSISKAAVSAAFAELKEFNEPWILAEAVREVVDCLVSRRLGQAARYNPGRTLVAAEVARLIRVGACIGASGGRAEPVGRVQGAVLRLLLSRGRDVAAAEDQCRLRAVVRIGERVFTGTVYHATEGREATDAKTAQAVIRGLSGGRLRLASPPTVLREASRAPWAGTAAVLAAAWAGHRILPWDVMASLQALYDGSWSAKPERDIDPEEPIEPTVAAFEGHPPITPLDRAATPDQMEGEMAETDHAVYSVVWERFAAAEVGPIETLYVRLDFDLEGLPVGALRVRFDGVACPGVEGGLERVVLGRSAADRSQSAVTLKDAWRDLEGMQPEFQAVPFAIWTMRPDELLVEMERARIGRPSTYAAALRKLHDKRLVAFPIDDGPLRLTPAGVATALAVEAVERDLSDPAFSARLTELLRAIETGEAGPRAVLTGLMPLIAPEHDAAAVGPRIWDNVPELEAAMDRITSFLPEGSLVSRADVGFAVVDG